MNVQVAYQIEDTKINYQNKTTRMQESKRNNKKKNEIKQLEK